MQLYTYYTKSHSFLFENFLKKSVNFFNEYELVIGTGEQHCHDGGFNSKNFGKTTFEKIQFIINSNEWESNEVIIFCDADVLFLQKTKEFLLNELSNLDMIFQNDENTCNTGIYLCRKNKKVKSLLEEVINNNDKFHNEQLALNNLIKKHNIKYKLLNSKIWNVNFIGWNPWDGKIKIDFPDDILMFHANYIVGIENKHSALKMAYDRFFNK